MNIKYLKATAHDLDLYSTMCPCPCPYPGKGGGAYMPNSVILTVTVSNSRRDPASLGRLGPWNRPPPAAPVAGGLRAHTTSRDPQEYLLRSKVLFPKSKHRTWRWGEIAAINRWPCAWLRYRCSGPRTAPGSFPCQSKAAPATITVQRSALQHSNSRRLNYLSY